MFPANYEKCRDRATAAGPHEPIELGGNMSYAASMEILIARRLWPLLFAACLIASVPAAFGTETAYIAIDAGGLEDLGPGWAYEGWLIVDGAPVSTGTFTVGGNGDLSRSTFAAEVADLDLVSTFVLTIEPVPDDDPGPSEVHMLGGDFEDGVAHITVDHPAALGDDFASASGAFILAAPSAGAGGDYVNGIWWLDLDAGPGPAYSLPTLPAGWAYEGWVVGEDGPMSTGVFTSVVGADSDGAGVYSGPYDAPGFPGQDFVTQPVDLTSGFAAVLTIEPFPDNGPSPFTLKPLIDGSIEDVGMGVLQPMTNMSAGFPTATVTMMGSAIGSETANLQLDLTGLDDLGSGWVYEGWLIVNGAPVSTGTFTVNSNGVLSENYFPTEVESIDAISAFVLTIEPDPDPDPSPSSVHLLAGDLVNHRARLTIGHPAAIGTDFSTAMGGYILAAPSSGGAASYTNGIWWLDPDAGPGPTLDLPDLPAGWIYEGWVAGSDGPVSTGRFASVTGADSDGAGPDSGPEATPGFPGQDFVDPAVDLTSGYAAVITVEPEPDNAPGPFTPLKPLIDPVIDDVGALTIQPMHLNPAPSPSGTAVLLTETTILAGGSVTGVGGVMWHSDLDIVNLSDRETMFTVQLLRSDQSNETPESASYMLAAGASVRYMDVYDSVFGFQGTGALRILAENSSLLAASRTSAGETDGSYGQSMPGFSSTWSIGFGEVGRLVGLSESSSVGSGFRTNIGVVNAVGGQAVVHIALYRSDGTWVRTLTRYVEAFEHIQLNRPFKDEVEVGYAVVWTSTPGARVYAYATVIDNQSDDPSFIQTQ
jgi:hypothetical protein